MSYEPTIIIKKSDLEKHRDDLEASNYKSPITQQQQVNAFLLDVLNTIGCPKIDGIELLICQPELTSFNMLVRKTLSKWDVQFAVSF